MNAMVTRRESVHITRLHIHPANRRDVYDGIEELAASIRAQGILHPLIVVHQEKLAGHYWVLDGGRRLTAARLTRFSELPCTIRATFLGEAKVLEVRLVTSCQREDLSPVEKARDMGRLRDEHFYTPVKIASMTGLSRATVDYYLRLLDLDAETQQRVIDGSVTVKAAQEAISASRAMARWQARPARSRPVQQRQAVPPRPARRKVAVRPPHFGKTHPLAGEVRDMCAHLDVRLPGHVGCGECWEQAIRRDERERSGIDGARDGARGPGDVPGALAAAVTSGYASRDTYVAPVSFVPPGTA